MNTLSWQITPISECTEALWSDWRDLFVQSHSHNPMLDDRFVSCLVSYYPADIYVAVGKQHAKIVTIFLLEKEKFGCWRNYMPSQTQVAPILTLPEVSIDILSLMSAIKANCIKLDLFGLDPREHAQLVAAIPEKSKEVYATNIGISFQGNFEGYWQDRPKKLRQNISRYMKRLTKEGYESEFKVRASVADIGFATDIYGMLESRGWKGKLGTALHPSNSQGQFYKALMSTFAETEQAAVFELLLNDEIVASRLCIYCQDTLITLKTTFNEDFKKQAVGRILLHELIEYIFQSKLANEIDFYTNASRDQMEWATSSRNMINASIYRYGMIEKSIAVAKKAKFWQAN